MKTIKLLAVGFTILFGIDTHVLGQTSFPMITHTHPVAVQRGKTSKIIVQGRMDFRGAYKMLIEGDGITSKILLKPPAKKTAKPPTVTKVPVELTVAPDAELGVREFRIATSLGISSIGQLVVVDDPTVTESKANNTRKDAEPIALPCVVNGRLEVKEDVDFYKFTAKKGEHLTFEVFCARLQDKIHDLQKHAMPMVTLYDAEGRELAANDHFFFADPMLAFTAPETGDYYVQIRESTYEGDARWVYALAATNRPYVSHIHPLAVTPGEKLQVTPIGSASLYQSQVSLIAPPTTGVHRVSLQVNGQMTNPATLIVTPLSHTSETEPNDTVDKANPLAIPGGVNGQIGKIRDLDCYRFTAKKGKAIAFAVHARRFGTLLNSTLHAVLEVMDAKGRTIASNFNTHSQDEAELLFTPPRDDEFVLRIRDLNSKGSPSSVYFISAEPAQPDFVLQCDPDKAMIGPGSSTTWFVKITRKNGFKGAVKVHVDGLPPGVTASPLTIPESMTEGAVILTAAKDAKIDVANVTMTGTAMVKNGDGKEMEFRRLVQPYQEIYSPGGGRAIFPVSMRTVAVTEPSDILKVEVDTQNVTLKPGQEVKIAVTVYRRSDYQKSISLDVLLRHLNRVYGNPLPPGITMVAGKSKTLLGKGNKGHIVLKAAAGAAPIENVPISVMCHVSINFVVKVSYSSEPILVSIKK